MKIRKLFSLFVTVLFGVFLLSACAPVARGFVQLPDGVQNGITAVVLVIVSFFIAKLIALVPFLLFLQQFREPLAFAIAAALIGWIQTIVPDAYGQVAILALQLILAVLAVFGVANELKRKQVKGFK